MNKSPGTTGVVNRFAESSPAIFGLLAAFSFAIASSNVSAQTVSFWDGTNGSQWSNAARWSSGVPSGNYNAVVNAGLVFQSEDYSINRLALGGGTVNMSGPSRTLNLTGTGVGNWALEWYSGSIRRSSGSGTPGLIETQSGSYSILDSSGLKELESIQINERGNVNWSGGNLHANPNSGSPWTLWRNLEGEFEVQGDLQMTGNGIFENDVSGHYRKSAGSGVHTVNWIFTNAGTLSVDRGTMRLVSQGNVLGGTTYLDWNNTSPSATLEIAATSTLEFGSIAGGGSHTQVRFLNSDINLAPDALFYIDAPTVVDVTVPSQFSFGGLGNANSRLDLLGSTAFNLAANAELSLGATLGSLTVIGDSQFNGVASSTFKFYNYNNLGHAVWNGGNIGAGTNLFTNDSSGRLDIAANNASVFGTASNQFVNLGIIEKLNATGTTSFFQQLTNSGTLLLGDGIMHFGLNSFVQETSGMTRLLESTSVMQLTGASLAVNGGFEGVGTIVANTLTLNEGWITPGLSAGTLGFDSSLHLGDLATLNFELGSQSDLLVVDGDFTLDGMLNVEALSGFGAGTYTLVDYGGAFADNGLIFGNMPSGFDYAISIDSGNSLVNLVVTSTIPEPASISLLLFTAGTLFVRQRTRQRGQRGSVEN